MSDTPTGSRQCGPRPSHLINRSEARKFILDSIQRTRPSLGINRVSSASLDKLEYWLREKIRSEVHSHPSVGQTFKLI
jgi:hypothetical protein